MKSNDPERSARAQDRRELAHRVQASRRDAGLGLTGFTFDDSMVEEARAIPAQWVLMSAVFGLGGLILAAVSLEFPPAEAMALLIASVGLPVASRSIGTVELRKGMAPTVRYLASVLVLVLPMFLAGSSIGLWMGQGTLVVQWGLAALICFNAVAALLLSGRFVWLCAAQVASWAGLAIVNISLASLSALTMMTLIFLLVARHQATTEREIAKERDSRERMLNRAEHILHDYEETGHGWFWETDRRGDLSYLSVQVANVMGKTLEEMLGRSFLDLFDKQDDSFEGERTISFHMSARSPFQDLAIRAATASAEERWWSVSGRPVYDGFGNFCGFRGSGSDLTEKRLNREKVTRLAQYDSLTGLANRFQMSQLLDKILTAPQERERECAVMLLDLDRFKNVNDSLGHPVGDELLKQVAGRLLRTVDDLGRVGRLGGDEFQILVPGRQPRARLAQLAESIIQALSQPYAVQGQRIVIGASVGVAIALDDGKTAEALIRNADLALYAAKDAGRGRMHFYSSRLHVAAEERNRLEQDLRDAIEEGNLELHYQPVVQVATEQIRGFEALLRWKHPVRGWMSPAKFIPVAEDTGLIITLGEWALRTACFQLAQWPEQVRCAVNVSPLQFSNPNLPLVVTNAIARAGIDPSRLELEITESVFLTDDRGTDAMFAALKKIGVRLALDDFGTGYSALGYLKKAPFDRIKIDQGFVRGATEPGSRNGAIIASITSLAQALGMDTTAEGVETVDELELVRQFGCSHVQGHIYERAMSGEDATARLAGGLAAEACGPQAARNNRRTMLRKVWIEQSGDRQRATIRNVSDTGALIEGVEGVERGADVRIIFSENDSAEATCRWASDDRIGVEFARPLHQFGKPRSSASDRAREIVPMLRKSA